MKDKFKIIAEGSYDKIRDIIPAFAFVSTNRDGKFRAELIIEEFPTVEERMQELAEDDALQEDDDTELKSFDNSNDVGYIEDASVATGEQVRK